MVEVEPGSDAGFTTKQAAATLNFRSIKPDEAYKTTQSVPVIDLHNLSEDLSLEQHEEIVQAISKASNEWGFFQVVNHGIDVELLEKAQQVSKAFFELPQEKKLKWAAKEYGFKEDGYGSRASQGGSVEYSRDYLLIRTLPERNIEKWPSEPPEYRETMARLSDEFLVLAKKLLGYLSEGVGLPAPYFENSLGEQKQSFLMSNYYPPFLEAEKVHGFVPHSDFGGITLLLQDIPGLLILKEDSWYMVEPIPGAITINICDFVELLSNGRYRSVIHRVRVNKTKSRTSIASNFSCSFDSTVSPAPELIDEAHPQAYKSNVKFGEYVAAVAKSGPTSKSYILMNKEEST